MIDIAKRVQEHYDVVNKKHEVVGVFLQGSQNYGLDYEGSDVDTHAIVLPKFEDFVLNKKPVSHTHILENNEHIGIKDIRLMFECFKKQNINFVEILFSKYKVMNPKYERLFAPMFENREVIAHYHNYAAVNCMCGMSMEKYKALEHPYPATLDKIEKYGYDPKQLHHIIRLNEFMKRYINGEDYADCLMSRYAKYLIAVKKGLYNLEEARHLAKETDDDTKNVKKKYMDDYKLEINQDVIQIFNRVLVDIIKYNFTSELSD